MDISFVIITYNDAGRLPRAIKSAALAAAGSGWQYEVWVVDNGSADNTQAVLDEFQRALGARLKIISLESNTGTTFSRNLALSRASGRLACVMDSDAEILGENLRGVAGVLEAFPEVGIIAPTILLPGGRPYDSVKRLPTLTDKLLKLPHIFLRTPAVNHDWYPDFPFGRMRCVDTAISCAWFFRRELFGLVGPLDERIFYAPEDVDWCLRAWKAGRAVVYYPGLEVMHHTRQVSHKKPFSATARSHLWGLLYYLRKHGYWFRRGPVREKWIRPLAEKLNPLLADWAEPGR